jgi:hypothetical protein
MLNWRRKNPYRYDEYVASPELKLRRKEQMRRWRTAHPEYFSEYRKKHRRKIRNDMRDYMRVYRVLKRKPSISL